MRSMVGEGIDMPRSKTFTTQATVNARAAPR